MSIGADSFGAAYFEGVYGGCYDARSPDSKSRALLRALRPFCAGGTLLDIGCAYGRFLAVADATGGFKVSGMDISAHAVAVATERLSRRGVRVRQGGVLDDPFPGERFDLVTMFDVIEHIPDLDGAFAAAKARLAPGGVLAISVPVYDGPVGAIVRMLDSDPTHVHTLGRHDWVERCAGAGLRVERWIGLYRTFVAGRLYLHLASRRLRAHSPAILLITTAA